MVQPIEDLGRANHCVEQADGTTKPITNGAKLDLTFDGPAGLPVVLRGCTCNIYESTSTEVLIGTPEIEAIGLLPMSQQWHAMGRQAPQQDPRPVASSRRLTGGDATSATGMQESSTVDPDGTARIAYINEEGFHALFHIPYVEEPLLHKTLITTAALEKMNPNAYTLDTCAQQPIHGIPDAIATWLGGHPVRSSASSVVSLVLHTRIARGAESKRVSQFFLNKTLNKASGLEEFSAHQHSAALKGQKPSFTTESFTSLNVGDAANQFLVLLVSSSSAGSVTLEGNSSSEDRDSDHDSNHNNEHEHDQGSSCDESDAGGEEDSGRHDNDGVVDESESTQCEVPSPDTTNKQGSGLKLLIGRRASRRVCSDSLFLQLPLSPCVPLRLQLRRVHHHF